MPRKIKSITNPRLKLDLLSAEDISRLHSATLAIIERTGVRFPSERALHIWEAHGASVDWDTMIVRAPGHLIHEALKKAPPAYDLAARDRAQLATTAVLQQIERARREASAGVPVDGHLQDASEGSWSSPRKSLAF